MRFKVLITALCLFISFACHEVKVPTSQVSPNNNQRIRISQGIVPEITLHSLSSALPAKQILVQDPYEKGVVNFSGFDFSAVLDYSFGSEWREWEQIRVNCVDGYEAWVPVKHLTHHHAWLAFRRINSENFKIMRRDLVPPRETSLSPFYLVWNSISDPEVKDRSQFHWPFQIAQMEPVKKFKSANQLVLRRDAPKNVIQGLSLFQRHCINCHSINGKGGKVGPELSSPRSPTEYWNRKFLKMWILKPTSIRADAKMPEFDKSIPEREKRVDQILDYLSDLASHR